MWKKAFDVAVSAMLLAFFIGYVNIHADIIGLKESPVPVSHQVEEFWEWFTWIVFAALALDVYLKYRKVRNPREFLKKHWLDILMLAFMPLFAGFKLAKISIKLVKGAKMVKSGFKAFQGARKIQKAGKK
ncbi:hypothetical protein [Nitrososphaera sp.]|uniref:hypothetical protein n=1 Tax=Nitrososphaera sp. TaxID=1971748 RepID=UPI00307FC67B